MFVYNVNQVVLDAIHQHGCVFVIRDKNPPFAIGNAFFLSICENYIVIDNRTMMVPDFWDDAKGIKLINTPLMMYRINYIDEFYNVFGSIEAIDEEILRAIKNRERSRLLNMYGYNDIECQAVTLALNVLMHQAAYDNHEERRYNSSIKFMPEPVLKALQDSPDPIEAHNPYTGNMNDTSGCYEDQELVVTHNIPLVEMKALFAPQDLSEAAKANLIMDRDAYLPPSDDTEIVAVDKDNIPKDPSFNPIAVCPIPTNVGGKTFYSVLKQVVEVHQPPTIESLPIPKKHK